MERCNHRYINRDNQERRSVRVLILDNSVATTGAVLSAIAMANALKGEAICIFVLPDGSKVDGAIREAGHEVITLPMVEIGRSFIRLATYLPMLLVNGLRFRQILARHRIDVLVANDYFNMLPLIVRLMLWPGRIVTIVRLLPKSQISVLNKLWLTSARLAANKVVAVSKAVLAQLPEALCAQLVYFPVGRGIDGASFSEPNQNRGCRFLYLANYIKGKGQDEALIAFSEMLKDAPEATLRLVGGDMGLEKNRAYRTHLEAQTREFGLAHAITFFGQVQDVEQEIRSADVILNFSKAESFSQTCAEAGLLGRPVVATRCGGPEEIVVDGHTGYLVPIADVQAMSNAMRTLANDAGLRHRMGRAAFEFTRQQFNPTQFKETMLKTLRGPLINGVGS